MKSSLGYEDGGAVSFEGADLLIGYRLPAERKTVTVGLCKAHLASFAQVGRDILSVGRPNYPSSIDHRLLVEIAARIRTGLHGDATYRSLIALASLHAVSDPAILYLAAAGDTIDVAILDGREPSCLIAPRSHDGHSAPTCGSRDEHSVDRRDELLIEIQVDHWQQFLFVPRHRVDTWIERAEQDAAAYPACDRRLLLGFTAHFLVSLYHKALMGDLPNVPASTIDWPDQHNLAAGAVCWLLRDNGLLDAAMSDPGNHIAIFTFEPHDSSLSLELERIESS